jgi:hypothetical protein
MDVLKKINKLLEKDCKIVYASLCLEPKSIRRKLNNGLLRLIIIVCNGGLTDD